MRCLLRLALLLSCGCPQAAGVRYPDLPRVGDGALHVVNFDVGQGDAVLVLYNGKSLLMDCGGSLHDPLVASRRLPRRLDALLGSRHIDYFLVTHYHQDHVGGPGRQRNRRDPAGIFSLVERDGVTIGTVLDRGYWNVGAPGATQKHFRAAVEEWMARGIVGEHRVVKPGDLIDMGGALRAEVVTASANGLLDRMQAIFPTFIEGAPPSENDYSVGVKLTLGNFEWFSAGDLSGKNVIRSYGPKRESYTDVESRVAESVGAVEVYRVNHHGSRHSTNKCFAQVLHPQVSVFSTGFNRYGHPDPDVYDRLKQYGDVFITGGADPKYEAHVAADIVYGDVEVLVAPDGARYWVNGKPYTALTDADEKARPDAWGLCQDRTGGPNLDPAAYEVQEHKGEAPSD
jgi:beta-lactamase superfamily II metal-dependent hydrolase